MIHHRHPEQAADSALPGIDDYRDGYRLKAKWLRLLGR
jgi:hypothetical protein